jgi:hypothetical protein
MWENAYLWKKLWILFPTPLLQAIREDLNS